MITTAGMTGLACFVPNITTPDIFESVTIGSILNDIRTGKHSVALSALPDPTQNATEYKRLKKKLPSWALNGTFTKKVDNNSFCESSGYFGLDIDRLNHTDLLNTKEILVNQPYVTAVWLSPSKQGLKVLLRVADDLIHSDKAFKDVYNKVEFAMAGLGITIDKACKDVRRLCFVGSDPEIYINISAVPFFYAPITLNFTAKSTEAIAIERCVGILLGSSAGNRHDARLKAGRLAGGYVAGGLANQQRLLNELRRASDSIADNGVTSAQEYKAITDGISDGQRLPIYDIDDDGYLYDGEQAVTATSSTTATTTAPAPLFNEALDAENNYCSVDLMQYIDNSHVIKRLSMQLARETYLPVNTVFLTGLAVFSAMASRKYAVQYPNGNTLPLGLYVIAEQPSGTSKTRCLNTFERPFKEIRKRLCNKALKEFKDYLNGLEDGKATTPDQKSKLKELETEWVRLKAGLFVTNGTAEALEPVTTKNHGFFSAVSSEQGLFNSLLGKSYKAEGSSNNNDMLLNGFDGADVNNVRVNRDAYCGDVVGAVCCFAQAGSIESVLKESNGTGLAERFLMLSEPHSLGKRDHTRVIESDPLLMISYQNVCSNMESILATPLLPEDLSNLFISPTGFQLINQYRNKIEPYLADGGRYSHISLRGAASKIDMQIMKIAANLHIADSSFEPNIPDKHVISAIAIAGELIEANLKLCQDKGIMGVKAEFTSILALFENDQRPRNERSITQGKLKTKPFKEFTGNKSQLIIDTLAEMVGQKLLKRSVDPTGKASYSPAQ
jgi:hypothetical protein